MNSYAVNLLVGNYPAGDPYVRFPGPGISAGFVQVPAGVYTVEILPDTQTINPLREAVLLSPGDTLDFQRTLSAALGQVNVSVVSSQANSYPPGTALSSVEVRGLSDGVLYGSYSSQTSGFLAIFNLPAGRFVANVAALECIPQSVQFTIVASTTNGVRIALIRS